MTLRKNRTLTYHAINYNNEIGEFHGKLSKKEFKEMNTLLNYCRVAKLSSNYSVGWTDDQTATLEIRFGQQKKVIVDYGLIGTFGLNKLYAKFFAWRRSINWYE